MKSFVAPVLFGLGAASADFPAMAGLNVPWNSFGYDVGGGAFDASWFEKYFASAEENGQNVARFWLHTAGDRAGLVYDSDGKVTGLTDTFTGDLRQLLSIAQKHKVVLQLCLWSFDMCKDETSRGFTNARVISDEAISRSYVEKALKPMLAAVSDFENMFVETINEPEWCMKGPGNTPDMVEAKDMQRFVAMMAEATHAAGRKVVTGSASLKWNGAASEAEAFYWSDEALQKAYPAGSQVGMDFYNVHYYDWMYNDQYGYDPMRKPASYWKLDKPTVVAELPATSEHYGTNEMLDKMSSNDFQGALFWAYNDPSFDVTPAIAPLQAFAQQQGASYKAVLDWLAFSPSPAPAPSPTPAPSPSPSPAPTPGCVDTAPDSTYTCEQQKSWGKCGESWMVGFCCQTCFECDSSCVSSGVFV